MTIEPEQIHTDTDTELERLSAVDLLQHLRGRDIRLYTEQGRLRINAPAGSLTPGIKALLAARKAEILDLLVPPAAGAPPITRLPRTTTVFPLSSTQERFWFVQQLAPDSPAYTVAVSLRVSGALKRAALEQAWRQVALRHELLRAAIRTVDGVPSVLLDTSTPLFNWVEGDRTLDAWDAEAALAWVRTVSGKPLDLQAGPLAELHAKAIAPHEYAVHVRIHHAISDAWSLGVVVRDLGDFYRAAATGRTAALPELTIQYVDYAQWQREWLQSPVWNRQVEYWTKQLGGARALDLPLDHQRPAAPTQAGDVVLREIDPSLRDRIVTFSGRYGLTPYMTLVAALGIVLGRHGNTDDVVMSTPVAGRQTEEVEGIVGPFINTLVMRLPIRDGDRVADLLRRARTVAIEAQQHQDAPFDRLVAELPAAREISRSQVMLNVLNVAGSLDLGELRAEPIVGEWKTALNDLTLFVDFEHSKRIAAEYSTDVFDRSTIERLVEHLLHVLEQMMADVDRPVTELDLLTTAERTRLVETWNDTARTWPHDASMVDLIEQQVRRGPDRIAVSAVDGDLTYAELDARANAVARALQDAGVGPDVLVGVGLERTSAMVVAILAVWKAGGAYVPIDPAYPIARIEHMLEDSGALVLVTERQLQGRWPATRAQIIEIDDLLTAPERAVPPRAVGPDHLAYVIYTSGSTGKPKGVGIPHGALINFQHAMAATPGLTADDVLLAVTTLSFDIAGLELHLPLMQGARIELATRDEVIDGPRLLERLTSRGVTVLQATPATWRLLIEAGWKRTPGLRALCGGEPMPRELADQLLDRCDEVWNMYGPTETTIWSTVERIERGQPILIGRPIANTEVYVLDAQGRPTPIGVPGELVIGGLSVARGYHERPELTADRFVPDPFSRRTGARLYRTGDLARWRADGRLDCLGRLDHQVKIRGFRIELGEIEAVLERHPAVRQAVVSVYEPSAGDRRLAAYVVAREGQAIDDGALRVHVREYLAEYMVPSSFTTMLTLPLTANGKVDRKALPAPTGARSTVAAGAGASTGVERSLAAIWAEVLKVSTVPVDENFFDLGGHSLLLAQVQRRVEQEFGQPVAMLDLFQYPTVRLLAGRISAAATAPVADGSDARNRMERQRSALAARRPGRPAKRDNP